MTDDINEVIEKLKGNKLEKYWFMSVDDNNLFTSRTNCTVGDAKQMLKLMASNEFYMKRVILELAIEWLEEAMEGERK